MNRDDRIESSPNESHPADSHANPPGIDTRNQSEISSSTAESTTARVAAEARAGRCESSHPNHSNLPTAARDLLLPLAPGGPLEPGRQANPPIRYDTTGWLSGASGLLSESTSARRLQPRLVVGVLNSSASLPLVRYDTTGQLSGAFSTPELTNDQGDVSPS